MSFRKPLVIVSAAIGLGAGLATVHPPAWCAEPTRPAPIVRVVHSPTSALVARAVAKKPTLLDYVEKAHRDDVATVLKDATLTTKAVEEGFIAHETVYDWLLDHPDRTSLAWQRLEIPCVEIVQKKNGDFYWGDDEGSDLTWRTVGQFEHGRIWYATGKVKASAWLPTVPVRAVVAVYAARTAPDEAGKSIFRPQVNIWLLCDSRLAKGVLRLAGASAPKLAEEGADQLLYFFSGIGRQIARQPDRLAELLGPAETKK